MSNYGLQTLFPKPKDLLQNQKENQRLTQTFSNSGRWLWISVTGCFRSANGTLLKLSSLPLQVERHLSSHWLSPWGSEVKHVLGLHGSKDIYLDWTGRLLTFLAQSGHERNPLQGSELFEHGHNSGRYGHRAEMINCYLGWLQRTASWRGVFPHRSSTSRSTCWLN